MSSDSWNDLYLIARGGPIVLCSVHPHDFIHAVILGKQAAKEIKKEFWVYEAAGFYWADENFPQREGIKVIGKITQEGKIEWRNGLQYLHDQNPISDELCPECNGTGEVAGDYFSEDGMTFCRGCEGKGVIR